MAFARHTQIRSTLNCWPSSNRRPRIAQPEELWVRSPQSHEPRSLVRLNDKEKELHMKVDMKFEVAIVPVSDVDRAKAFYTKLGWRVDHDIVNGDEFRAVQLTPPTSAASITFGKGVT